MQTNLLSRKSPSSAPLTPPPPAKRRRVRGPVAIVILGLVLVFAAIAGTKVMQIMQLVNMGKTMVMPPTTVTSAKVEQANWQPMVSAVGSIAPVQGATISAELAGPVAEVVFQSGRPVKKGDILLKLDASAEQ